MSIHAADALMEIFGFKRVAGDEITLDNPPSLDDDGGSLNEGIEMGRTEELIRVLNAGVVERDARIATQEAQIKVLQSNASSWQSGYDEGRRMGGKHCMLTVDQLRAELAALNAKLDASKFCADVADDLRAELAEAKETISRYETTAENCDVLRAEPAAIKSAQVAKQDYGPLTCDYCGAETRDPWHGSGSINGIESKHIHACDNCRDLLPVAKQVVIPDADHSEDVRAMVVPEGYKLVPIEPTAAQCFTAAFNLCNEFGDEFVRDNKQFALAAYRSLVAASPSAKGGE